MAGVTKAPLPDGTGRAHLLAMEAIWNCPGPKMETIMSTPRKNKFFATLDTFATVFGSAAAVSAAVEAGRAPKSKHLESLGIDPVAFRSIGRI